MYHSTVCNYVITYYLLCETPAHLSCRMGGKGRKVLSSPCDIVPYPRALLYNRLPAGSWARNGCSMWQGLIYGFTSSISLTFLNRGTWIFILIEL